MQNNIEIFTAVCTSNISYTEPLRGRGVQTISTFCLLESLCTSALKMQECVPLEHWYLQVHKVLQSKQQY
jgi:hypothetical protein